jgi:hypothetical protein
LGLDLIVEGCARPGHEAEWRELVEHAFSTEKMSEAQTARFNEISIPAYERLGAPRVGHDPAADAWIIEARKATTPEEKAAALKDFEGYYVVSLVTCDGVPQYSHGGMYEGVDETSFRGKFLDFCGDVLSRDLIEEAWKNKLPEAAAAYGRALLAAADRAEAGEARPKPAPRGLLSRLGFGRPKEEAPLEEQLDIVRSAGRWHVFWGERGHPIHAWF